MKQILFLLSFVGFCLVASSQEVKEKTKKEYKAPSAQTKVVKESTSSNKAYATNTMHYAAKKHYVQHKQHTYKKHHIVHKKHPVIHHVAYKKTKVKHEKGETKVVHKT